MAPGPGGGLKKLALPGRGPKAPKTVQMGWWVEKGGCELKKCVCSVTTVDDSDEKKKLQVEPKPYAHNKSTGALLS